MKVYCHNQQARGGSNLGQNTSYSLGCVDDLTQLRQVVNRPLLLISSFQEVSKKFLRRSGLELGFKVKYISTLLSELGQRLHTPP